MDPLPRQPRLPRPSYDPYPALADTKLRHYVGSLEHYRDMPLRHMCDHTAAMTFAQRVARQCLGGVLDPADGGEWRLVDDRLRESTAAVAADRSADVVRWRAGVEQLRFRQRDMVWQFEQHAQWAYTPHDCFGCIATAKAERALFEAVSTWFDIGPSEYEWSRETGRAMSRIATTILLFL
jgi:hypothetical protein